MAHSHRAYSVIVASSLLLASCGSSPKHPSSTTTTTVAPTTVAGITRCYSSQQVFQLLDNLLLINLAKLLFLLIQVEQLAIFMDILELNS